MTFNEAVEQFEDKSIDVLHIDGSHHYNDVKWDFETWFSKVKDDGIIMLHDVSSDIVLGDVMGSYKYWKELQEKYPCADVMVAPLSLSVSCHIGPGSLAVAATRKMVEEYEVDQKQDWGILS